MSLREGQERREVGVENQERSKEDKFTNRNRFDGGIAVYRTPPVYGSSVLSTVK
jgi:hypothetical protein